MSDEMIKLLTGMSYPTYDSYVSMMMQFAANHQQFAN
jgi:hypothetical protein